MNCLHMSEMFGSVVSLLVYREFYWSRITLIVLYGMDWWPASKLSNVTNRVLRFQLQKQSKNEEWNYLQMNAELDLMQVNYA